jgi:predicted membrane chloride channel (bestrophin family)
MWILKFLPDWIFYAIFLVGVIGFALTYLFKYIPIPFLYVYRKPIQIGSVLAIIFGTFMSGAIYDNEAWEARVKEMEAKVAKAEEQSKEANTVIESKVEKAKEKIVQKQVVVKQYIDREIVKYDNTCVIPKEFVEVHNKAATK